MAKQSGLGDNAYLGGYNLSGDVAALSTIRGGPAALDVTAIDKFAHERVGGLRSGEISFNTWFNDAAAGEHVALKGLPTADVQVMYCRGTALGNQAAAMVGKQVNYDWTRGADGSLQGAVQCLDNGYGLEWCRLLTPAPRTDLGATTGASVDDGAASAFGLSAYLQVLAWNGVDATVKIQESSDNGATDPFADVTGGGFAQITSTKAERIQTSLTLAVERYLRAVSITTGGFTSLVFAVAYNRHLTAVAY